MIKGISIFLSKSLVLLAGAALLASCEARHENVSKDPIERGYELIDQDRPAEAAAYYEGLAKTDGRPEVRVAWASALAAQGGVKVDSYWGFVVGFKAPLLNLDAIESTGVLTKVRKLLLQLDGKVDFDRESDLGKLAEALGVFELYRQRIASIPVVSESDRPAIAQAMQVLAGSPKSGGRLYRAILGFVLLRTDLEQGFAAWNGVEAQFKALDLEHPGNDKNRDILCSLNLAEFGNWVSSLSARVDELSADLVVAFPSKQAEMTGASVSVHQALAPLQWTFKASCR